MKTKALFLIIIFTISSFPQESILYWKLYEIFIGIQNLKENFETPEGILNEEVRFEMTGIGIRWYPTSGAYSEPEIDISNNFETAYYPPGGYETANNTVLNLYPGQTWYGYNFYCNTGTIHCNESPEELMDNYVWGLYEFKATIFVTLNGIPITTEDRGRFYIDFRDFRNCGEGFPSPVNGAPYDIWIKYDGNTSPYFFLRSEGPTQNDANDNGEWEETFNDSWSPINNNSYLSIWDIKKRGMLNPGVPSTSEFPNFWQNCLAVITSQTGNHSRLVWGAYPDESFNVTNYKIYRKIDNHNWLFCGQTNSSTFTFIDSEIETGNKSGVVKYYVKAYL